MRRTRSTRRLALVLTGAAALLLSGAGYALASAGSAPAAVTLSGYYGDHDHQQMRPEAGDLLIATGGINTVSAFGPVAGTGGTDREHSPFSDTWTFGNGSVNVLHAPPPAPVLDLVTCSAIIDQRDAWWKFAGGTGADWGAQGSGKFTELALFSFQVDKRGHCDFDAYGHMGQDSYGPYMKDHGRVLRPGFFSVEVQFVGMASLPKHQHTPTPTPTPTYTTPAPPVTSATVPAPTPTYSTTAPTVS